MKKSHIKLSIFILIIIIAFVINPTKYLNASLNGLITFGTIILPSLLPFLFLTKVLTETKVVGTLSQKIKFTQKLFKTPPISSYIFLMSILTGYPIGAKLTADFYEKKEISRQDAFKITTFCSTSGPMFLYASIGTAMLASKLIGLILLLSHILGAILNGILFRGLRISEERKSRIQTKEIEEISIKDCMWNSIQSILLIGGFIIFFFALISALDELKVFSVLSFILSQLGIDEKISWAFLSGIVEISHGTVALSTLTEISLHTKIILISILTSFGGISTICQSLIFFKKFNMPTKFFILIKICQTILTTFIISILILIFHI